MSKVSILTFTSAPVISVRDTAAPLEIPVTKPARSRAAAKISAHPGLSVAHPSWVSQLRKAAVRSFLALVSSPRFQANMAVGMVAILLVGSLSYIFLINGLAAKGYEIRKLQSRIQEQNDIQHSLEIKTAELSSLGIIDQAVQKAGLVAVKNEEFLKPAQVTALRTTK